MVRTGKQYGKSMWVKVYALVMAICIGIFMTQFEISEIIKFK